MNIKNLVGTANAISNLSPSQAVNSAEKTIKSESAADRDANGQQLYEQKKKKEKMTREQAEKALQVLCAKSFMKDMSWKAKLIDEDGYFYALVTDSEDKTIRKIAEYDLWELLEVTDSMASSKGNLLKRTA